MVPDKTYLNLHFLPDSPYSKSFIERCERLNPGANTYVSFCNQVKVKFLDENLVRILPYKPGTRDLISQELHKYKAVYINYLDIFVANFLNRNKRTLKGKKVIWFLWGADLYYVPYLNFNVYQPFSSQYTKLLNGNAVFWKLKDQINFLLSRPSQRGILRAFNRVDYCLTPITDDIRIASQALHKGFQTMPFSFLSLGEMFSTYEEMAAPGNNLSGSHTIQVGNSGDPANNHYEIFLKLVNINTSHDVFCPLAYGDADYISAIVQKGKEILKERFEAMTDFMPKEAYYQKLATIKFAIFNHNIQQAFGNILGLLWSGAKVFLNEGNAVYKTLKDWDISVFTIEHDLTNEALSTVLDEFCIKRNQEILYKIFNDKMVDKYYENMLNITQ